MADNKGYTLIEIMVAVAVFAVVIAAPAGFFASAVKGQQKALVSQGLTSSISYNLEYISRALRMAKKDDINDINCLSGHKVNYELTRGGEGIKFRNYQDECQEFYREYDAVNQVYRIKEAKNGSNNYLTPSNLDILYFEIGPNDSWDQSDYEQPKVTIFFEAKGVEYEKAELQPVLKVQTSVSQRNLDVVY